MGADHVRIFVQSLPGSDLRVISDAIESRANRLAESLGTRRHLHRNIGERRRSPAFALKGDNKPILRLAQVDRCRQALREATLATA